jgi:oligopeptide transport system ATP-binding protein
VPRRVDDRRILPAISGAPPNAIELPTGCAFHPRCPLAEDECRTTVPELRAIGDGHRAACLFAERVSSEPVST